MIQVPSSVAPGGRPSLTRSSAAPTGRTASLCPTSHLPDRRPVTSVRSGAAMTAPGLAVSLSHVEGLSRPRQADLLELARTVEAAGAAQLVLSEHVVLGARITGHP